MKVHKSFYASGFLYHSASRNILLQQSIQKNIKTLTLFRKKSTATDPKAEFHEYLKKMLGIAIPLSSIFSVYDYTHSALGEQYIFYALLPNKASIESISPPNTEWIPLAKLTKYPMTEQTRHDIIIAERVMRAVNL